MHMNSNNLLPATMKDLNISYNDVHKYSTRPNICFTFIRATLMFIPKTLETQVFVYGMLYSPKFI